MLSAAVTLGSCLITGIVSILVCMINNHYQRKEAERKHEETIALMDYKLGELTKRVEKHNNLVERTYRLEELTTLQEEKIKVVNHRVEDLENLGRT